MTTAHPWDAIPNSSGYAKWEDVGDSIKGTVVAVGVGPDLNNNDCPQVIVDIGETDPITVTASQAQLKTKLMEARPKVGDTIAIMFTGVEKRPGGKTLKEFDVAVKSGDTYSGGTESADEEPVGGATQAARPSAADLI